MKTKVEFFAAALLLAGTARAGWTPPESSVTPPAVVTLDVLGLLGLRASSPQAALVVGSDGALYGSSYYGGTYNSGRLFRLGTDGNFTEPYDFVSLDGRNPSAALVTGPDGALYGSTYYGGTYDEGTLFQLATNGAFAKLHDFVGNLGIYPSAAMVVGPDGALYGSTYEGGYGAPLSYCCGTLFRLANGVWTKLHDFNYTDGANPSAALVAGPDGALYGSTYYGGTYNNGTLFRLATNGAFAKLHDFNGSDGAYPFFPAPGDGRSAALVAGPDGALYAPTPVGGTNQPGPLGYGSGTLFRLATNGTFTRLHDFNGTDGANPQAALVAWGDGALYGSTYYGGTYGGTNGFGTLFRLATDGTLTNLHDFNGTDGANPKAALVAGPDGALYGSTCYGGTYNNGTLFRLATNGTFTKLHDFNGTNGANPQAALVAGPDYALYGVAGTLFKIVLNRSPVAKCRNTTLSASTNCTVRVSAADVDDGSYDPDAGDTITAMVSPTSLTGVGWHTVILTVTDNHGASSTCAATVTVQDTMPPTIACPNDIVANATSPSGAVMNFPDPAASDNCSVAGVSCSPASGSAFAVGDTTVSCTAADGAGNQSSCAFRVHIKGPAEQTADLIALAQSLGLQPGIANSLIVKLEAAASALDRGDIEAVCGSLGAFLNEANVQNGKALTSAQADLLMTQATRILAVVGCR